MTPPDPNVEIWLRMYEEQIRHGRHHETLRSQATNLVVIMSGAALAFLASGNASKLDSSLLGAFIIAINVYGFLMSLKHYERCRLHVAVASRYRDVVSDASPIDQLTINAARRLAKREHQRFFPISRRLRAYVLWAGLHLVLACLGARFLF